MDYFISPYNFVIYPFVAIVEDIDIVPDKEEVDHVFEVPIEFFLENSPTCYEIDIVPSITGDFPFFLIRNGKTINLVKELFLNISMNMKVMLYGDLQRLL